MKRSFGRCESTPPIITDHIPALTAAGGEKTAYRFLELFTAQIRNPHTRRAYARDHNRGDGSVEVEPELLNSERLWATQIKTTWWLSLNFSANGANTRYRINRSPQPMSSSKRRSNSLPKFDFSAYLPKPGGFPKLSIPKIDIPDLSGWASQFVEAQKALQSVLFPEIEKIGKSFVFIAPRAQEGIINLALSGWYLDLEMTFPQISELGHALLQGNADEAEAALVEHFEGRADSIEAELVRKFPRRAHLIQAAFRAHRQKEYDLAIPVFLTQSDGICTDIIRKSPFRSRDKKPETADYVETIATDTLKSAFLSPLARIIPINASEKHRRGSNALNRHTVLHGESLDYGTKANSLRAISLLNYVGDVLRDEIEP